MISSNWWFIRIISVPISGAYTYYINIFARNTARTENFTGAICKSEYSIYLQNESIRVNTILQ